MTARDQQVTDDAVLQLRWPWWVHPAWALMLLTGVTMLLAIGLSADTYVTAWQVPKFIDGTDAGLLLVGLLTLFLGTVLASGMAARSGSVELRITPDQVRYLRRAFKVLSLLTVLGYVFWAAQAFAEGVRLGDLLAVVSRQPDAISDLKANARPVAGLTTLTQFGPVAIAIGVLLRKVGHGGKGYRWLVIFACVRGVFYAERLAIIEVLLPILLLAALTVRPDVGRRRAALTRLGPLLAVPVLWLVFAVSEYTRSWVYYQQLTDSSFPTWVSLRLLGYYATGYNNSALLAEAHEGLSAPPYFTVDAFWNAPGVSSVLAPPPMQDWWTGVLIQNSNPEFNNTGSFLTTYAELGIVGMLVFWLVVGLVIGGVFSTMSKGSVPGLLAYATLFVGILELPRFIYWSQGRATPVILALLLVALTYRRVGRRKPAPTMTAPGRWPVSGGAAKP